MIRLLLDYLHTGLIIGQTSSPLNLPSAGAIKTLVKVAVTSQHVTQQHVLLVDVRWI